MSRAPLLIELFTEELPPKALRTLGEVFAQTISHHLSRAGLLGPQTPTQGFASPRRLAVLIDAVSAQGADQARREKLLPVSVGLDAQGAPTAPLLKKLQTLGLQPGPSFSINQLIKESDGKQDVLFVDTVVRGARLAEAAQEALDAAIAALPIPKLMRYQRPTHSQDGAPALEEIRFVRPAHGLVALHGEALLPLRALGLQADRITHGHRFHSQAPIVLAQAADYAHALEAQGHVIACFQTRRAQIVAALQKAATPHQPVMPDALVDEVTSLVEWPVILQGQFEEAFLEVPQECLILTMQQNQKYFALTDASGRLVNRFLLVSNLASTTPSLIVQGNERVLRARLSDAQFFFKQDRRRPLRDRVRDLDSVVYHNKMGTQGQRIERLRVLSRQWAPLLETDPELADQAARLAKADLVTDMVGEFPELQGVVGRELARHDQEPEAVALAIEDHYRPRFAGDSLARNGLGLTVALADKIETLVGIWGIGLAPSGDKDPFALRRAALGVVRILVECDVPASLNSLLQDALQSFSGTDAVAPHLPDVQIFILDRARAYLKDKGHQPSAIEAVLAVCPDRISQIVPRIQAVMAFMQTPQAEALCAANKRIGNILKKASDPSALARPIDAGLLQEPAERALAQALAGVSPIAQAETDRGHYTEAMLSLSGLREAVDAFFDGVMVNAEDPALRANRLALLSELHRAMNQVADLSGLAS